MRDIIFIFDNTETIVNRFKKDTFQNSVYLGPMTNMTLESLYDEASPVVLTSSSLKTILEYAQLYTDMLNNSNFNTMIAKYNTPLYGTTLLSDSKFLAKLSQFSQSIQKIYEQINYTIKDALNEKNDPVEALKIINNKYDVYKFQNLKILLQDTMDQFIWIMAFELLKAFLIVEQLKAGDWDIRKINEFLILAIPIKYITKIKEKTLNFLKDQSFKYDLAKGFDEAILGISYEKLPTTKDQFNPSSYQYIDETSYAETFQKFLITNLSTVFNNKASLKNYIKSDNTDILDLFSEQYIWNIYGIGHGSEPSTNNATPLLMGLTKETLFELVHYLNDKIKTRFFFSMSCFLGGSNLRNIHLTGNQNYILGVGAISNASTGIINKILPIPFTVNRNFVIEYSDVDFKNQKLKPSFYLNFKKFFKSLRDRKGSYFEVINYIHSVWSNKAQRPWQKFASPLIKQNIPQIKFPHSDWFQVADLKKHEALLSKLFIDLHEQSRESIVINNKEVAFIYTKTIYPKELTYDYGKITVPIIIKGKMPTIISMVPGSAKHYFEFIDASDFSLTQIALAFMGIAGTYDSREFYIKELRTKNPFFSSDESSYSLTDKQLFSDEQKTKDLFLVLKNVVFRSNSNLADGANFAIMLNYLNKNYFIVSKKYSDLITKLTPANIKKHVLNRYLSNWTYPHSTTIEEPFENIVNYLKNNDRYTILLNLYDTIKDNQDAVLAWIKQLSKDEKVVIKSYNRYHIRLKQTLDQLKLLSLTLSSLAFKK